jgi:hypothetical protein
MRFKEIHSWYVEPEPYLCWGAVLIALGMLWGAWVFCLSPRYVHFVAVSQENDRLWLETKAQSKNPSSEFEIAFPEDIFKFLVVNDQTSDFLQALSAWVEKQHISVQKLSAMNGPEGLSFELMASGESEEVIAFLNKFNDIPLLVTQVKLKINWSKSNAAAFELSGLVHGSKAGKFDWNFAPYSWGNLPLCDGISRYQGWLSVTGLAKKSWLYREGSCGHEWVKMDDSSGRRVNEMVQVSERS